jgi:cell cycle sensor histidine kinase DivJ
MPRARNDIAGWIAKRGGAVVNLVWLATVAAAAPSVWPIMEGPVWLKALYLIAAAFPAIAGFVLMSRLDRAFERFALALFWTGLAAAVTISGDGITGAGVLAFLLAPAVAAASGGREAIIKASALAGLTALVVGVLQFTGFVRPISTAFEFHLPFMLGTTLVIALGFGFASIRAMRDGDRARAEAEHGRVRARAFDAAPAALLACGPDGHIVAASRGVRELSPGLPRELIDLPISDLGFDDEDRIQLAAASRRAAVTQLSDNLSVRGTRGRAETIRMDCAPIYGGSVAVLAQDRTVEADAAIRAAEAERARAREDVRSKSQYLASVSHELRTPLNAIIGFSDVMKARLFGPLPARYAEYADLIHESGQHLMDLIGDVLDMSKIEADRYELTVEQFDIAEVVAISTKLMRLQSEEAGLTLTVKAEDGPVQVIADRKALRQILLNLLSNAVKFTPEGGAIVVMARASGENLILAVGDSGVGISPEEAAKLGQPYTQATSARDSDQRGTGLGLSLVRALAELHGGSMSIASRKGEGTTISVSLPILAEPRGSIGRHPQLDVHRQIERAQQAGTRLVKAAG